MDDTDIESFELDLLHPIKWQREPQTINCYYCRNDVTTVISYSIGPCAVSLCSTACMLFAFTLWIVFRVIFHFEASNVIRILLLSSIGCLFLFLDLSLDVNHRCPVCQSKLGKRSPF